MSTSRVGCKLQANPWRERRSTARTPTECLGFKGPLPSSDTVLSQVWYFCDNHKYEFELVFDLPVTYPHTAPELILPALDGRVQFTY